MDPIAILLERVLPTGAGRNWHQVEDGWCRRAAVSRRFPL